MISVVPASTGQQLDNVRDLMRALSSGTGAVIPRTKASSTTISMPMRSRKNWRRCQESTHHLPVVSLSQHAMARQLVVWRCATLATVCAR